MKKTGVEVDRLPAILTLPQVAELAHVKPRTVRSWVAKGLLPNGRPRDGSSRLYFSARDVLKVLGVEEAGVEGEA